VFHEIGALSYRVTPLPLGISDPEIARMFSTHFSAWLDYR
jgi:hypothetical protein